MVACFNKENQVSRTAAEQLLHHNGGLAPLAEQTSRSAAKKTTNI